jgi:hypothetical protein
MSKEQEVNAIMIEVINLMSTDRTLTKEQAYKKVKESLQRQKETIDTQQEKANFAFKVRRVQRNIENGYDYTKRRYRKRRATTSVLKSSGGSFEDIIWDWVSKD